MSFYLERKDDVDVNVNDNVQCTTNNNITITTNDVVSSSSLSSSIESNPMSKTVKSNSSFNDVTYTNVIQYSITFRPLKEADRDQIKKLHEELFPVEYTDLFYDTVVQNLTMDKNPLFSCVAVARQEDEERNIVEIKDQYDAWEKFAEHVGVHRFRLDSLYDRWDFHEHLSLSQENYLTSSCKYVVKHGESIVACVVGTFLDVAKVGQDTVEQLILYPEKHNKMFYIMTLGSNESFRGLGLGSKLIHECINIVEQVQSCGVIYLHVITYNKTAIRFYERLGFHRIKEIDDYYSIDDKLYNCYLYARFTNGKFLCTNNVIQKITSLLQIYAYQYITILLGNRRSIRAIFSSVYQRFISFFTPS